MWEQPGSNILGCLYSDDLGRKEVTSNLENTELFWLFGKLVHTDFSSAALIVIVLIAQTIIDHFIAKTCPYNIQWGLFFKVVKNENFQ